jgi:hypothetical protein
MKVYVSWLSHGWLSLSRDYLTAGLVCLVIISRLAYSVSWLSHGWPSLSRDYLTAGLVCLFSITATFLAVYTPWQVEHLYACRQDIDSSNVVACRQHKMCCAVCWLRTRQPCIGPFWVDRFRHDCMCPRQNKHTFVLSWWSY